MITRLLAADQAPFTAVTAGVPLTQYQLRSVGANLSGHVSTGYSEDGDTVVFPSDFTGEENRDYYWNPLQL